MDTQNRFQSKLLGGAALVAMVTFSLVAAAKLSKTGTSNTEFKAAGPAGLTIAGSTADMKVDDDGTTVTLTVALANLSTGIGLRDEHTKKAIEVDKYPTTTLTVPRASLKFPAAGADSSGDAQGMLTLHGQTKPVTFHYSATNNGTINVKGNATINVDDFGVNRPSYLGVTVKPQVELKTSFQATDGN